jgi:rhodanese-related sulfurtransferase
MAEVRGNAYAGDLEVQEAWHLLAHNDKALLIDVRTHAEWSYVGVPVLDSPEREILLVEWLSYPAMQVHTDFGEQLLRELEDRHVAPDAPLLFLCRSGVRSRHAAIEMTGRWQGPCFNIAGGFEGDLNDEARRASVNGWKKAGLPWRQF